METEDGALKRDLEEKPINGNDIRKSDGNLIVNDGDVISLSSSSSSSSDDDVEENTDDVDFGDITIPYKTVYEVKDEHPEYFLVGVPVRVKIIEKVHQPASHRFNPFLYTIEIINGKHKWTVKRRYNRFRQLFRQLEIFRASVVVQHPTLVTRFGKIPKFPHRPEFIILSEKSREKMMRRLQKFLQNVVNHDRLRNCKPTLDFLEVSHLSFIEELGGKQKEGEVLKKAGGHTFPKGVFRSMKLHWHKRWLIVKDNFITYVDKDDDRIRDVLLFDKFFTVDCDESITGMDHGLMIKNDARHLLVKLPSGRQMREWFRVIVNMMAKKGCEYIGEHRFDSFAPIRKNSLSKWYIDGADYFSDVADAIANAKEEIFITDWWLSPELCMKRPVEAINKWQLDLLLKDRAENGVKVFIILWKEVEMAISINSAYTKRTLMMHHPNIQVLRHPDHVTGPNATLLWAHHEKIVCIDQKVAFLGGLDLCYGRWDDQSHRLLDFGSAQPTFLSKTNTAVVALSSLIVNHDAIDSAYHREQLKMMEQGQAKMFIGKDYQNPYVKDIAEVEKPFTDLIDRNTVPRMPWHDIGCMVVGNAARDVGRHFIQRWNFTKHGKAKEQPTIPFLVPKVGPVTNEEYRGPIDRHTSCSVQILRSCSSWSTGGQILENSIHDAYVEIIRSAKYYVYIENQFFITSLPNEVDNKIGDVIVERILTAFNNDETFRVYIVMPLLPSFPGEIGDVNATAMCFIESWNLKSIRKIYQRLQTHGIDDPSDYITVNGLRTHADLRGELVTEIVYVHSKLLIADDCVAIIGSANVNDRSMLGSRDSEIAIHVEDTSMVPGLMNKKEVEVGKFCSSMRRKLFQEHLGLLNEPYANVLDPISDEFFKDGWMGRAKINTNIYDKIFRCLPSNEVRCYTQLQKFKSSSRLNTSNRVEAKSLISELRGYLVEKPLNFLIDQDLRPPVGSNEKLVPNKVFT